MLDNLAAKHIPYATANALNEVGKIAQAKVEEAMPRVFDRPTPFVRKSIWTQRATPKRQWVEVRVKDARPTAGISRSKGIPVNAIAHHVEGGIRTRKPFENLLQARGLMPRGWYTVAGKDVPLDQYGNVPASVINRVLSQLQAHSAYSLEKNESATSKAKQYKAKRKRLQRYFVAMPGTPLGARIGPGIWERTTFGFGSAIRPLFIYVRSVSYSKELPFAHIIKQVVEQNFAREFGKAIAYEIAHAK